MQTREIQNQRAVNVEGDSRKYSGYGIVYNSDSHPMYFYHDGEIVEAVERITPEVMSQTDMTDIISAFNHNFEKIFGRTSAGTLSVTEDQNGWRYEFEVPPTTAGNDLIVSTRRGDIKGSSFVFTMDWEQGYDISQRDDGKLVAIPKKITKVYEMGPVVNPAYPETTAQSRDAFMQKSIKEYLEKQDQQKEEPKQEKEVDTSFREREIELLKLA